MVSTPPSSMPSLFMCTLQHFAKVIESLVARSLALVHQVSIEHAASKMWISNMVITGRSSCWNELLGHCSTDCRARGHGYPDGILPRLFEMVAHASSG